jgi:uncharacterized membrane protein YeaQ/YmgE (transglycosylase-associated protein family)
MWNLPVFVMIGFLAGAAARMFYPGRQPMRILSTLVLSVGGALVGGMFSWLFWPSVAGQFQTGNLIMSLVGAAMVILVGAFIAYKRNVSYGGHTTS